MNTRLSKIYFKDYQKRFKIFRVVKPLCNTLIYKKKEFYNQQSPGGNFGNRNMPQPLMFNQQSTSEIYPPLPQQPPPPPPPPPPTSSRPNMQPPLPSAPPPPLPPLPTSGTKQIPSLIQSNNADNSHNQSKIMPLLNLTPTPLIPAPAPPPPPPTASQQQPISLLDLDQIKPSQSNNSNHVNLKINITNSKTLQLYLILCFSRNSQFIDMIMKVQIIC